MVSFQRTQHYIHSSVLDHDKIFRNKPILVVGASGSGKSIFMEKTIEQIEDNVKNSISIFLVDVSDVLESAFCMFPATEHNHLKKLEFQYEKPEARKDVKLWCLYGKSLFAWFQHS
jgi:ABC-type dipeptide/oligopeptide/nickel transport system ATPase component